MLTDSDGRARMRDLLTTFRSVTAGLPEELAQAVETKIREYGQL